MAPFPAVRNNMIDVDLLLRRIRDERERWGVPGVALGVSANGHVEALFDGVADLETGAPVTADTRFRIASVTKPFTATLAMSLAEEDALALDEPLPGVRVAVTLRQALSHTSGLACEWPSRADFGSDDDALLRLAEAEPERLPVAPGQLFSYCNVGYWLVGAAIARVTRRTFEEAMKARLLEPLGLERTSFAPDASTARGHVPLGDEDARHRPVATEDYPRMRRPSGGLYSTVADLLRFARHHLGEPGPLAAATSRLMQERQTALPGGGYGLGWSLDERPDEIVVGHNGSVAGYQSALVLVPAERFALAALTNSAHGSFLIRGVLEELGLAPPEPVPVDAPAEQLVAAAGRYRHQTAALDVLAEDGRLRVHASDVDPTTGERSLLPPYVAIPVGPDEYAVLEGPLRWVRLDVPRSGFLRSGVLYERVAAP